MRDRIFIVSGYRVEKTPELRLQIVEFSKTILDENKVKTYENYLNVLLSHVCEANNWPPMVAIEYDLEFLIGRLIYRLNPKDRIGQINMERLQKDIKWKDSLIEFVDILECKINSEGIWMVRE